ASREDRPPRLRRHPPAAAGRAALSGRRPRCRRNGRPALVASVRLSHERALAALPLLSHSFGQGPRPAHHPARRAGGAPARRGGAARGSLRAGLRARRPRGAYGGPPLLRGSHRALRRADAAHQPLPPCRRRRRHGGLPGICLRSLEPAGFRASAGGVLGAAAPEAAHRAGAGARGCRRGRGDVARLRLARL
ncbi:MAG: hypothetical protein AVDCRST_MAG01-01-176, partial [uncultured Rubrobacteraceae bacterium]